MDGQTSNNSAGNSNKKIHVVWVVIVVVVAVAAFFGGVQYQKSKTPVVAARAGGFTRGAAGAGGFAGRGGAGGAATGSFVSGTVLSSDSSSITVKNMAGGSQIVILAPSTQYRKAVDGTANDVTVGSMVTVTGSTNSDGSLTAQSVQIRTGTSTPPNAGTPPGQ